MSSNAQLLGDKVRELVNGHYARTSAPLLLSKLGLALREQNAWPPAGHDGSSLQKFIESLGDNDLQIVRDPAVPAYIAVATRDSLAAVSGVIANRTKASTTVPDLEELPRSVLLAFCAQQNSGESVYLSKEFPFKYRTSPPSIDDRDQYWEVPPRYRRNGLMMSAVTGLGAADRLDLQKKIAKWCLDNGVSIESLYRHQNARSANALERLIAAQPPGVAARMLIPSDIALLLSRND